MLGGIRIKALKSFGYKLFSRGTRFQALRIKRMRFSLYKIQAMSSRKALPHQITFAWRLFDRIGLSRDMWGLTLNKCELCISFLRAFKVINSHFFLAHLWLSNLSSSLSDQSGSVQSNSDQPEYFCIIPCLYPPRPPSYWLFIGWMWCISSFQ